MPKRRKPTYSLHKATGQARVRINGKDHDLGAYGSPESREMYEDLSIEWFARSGDVSRETLTVDDLCLLFMDHADRHYRRKDGRPTGETTNLRNAPRLLIRVHGTIRVRAFGPRKLKEVRQAIIDAGMCRININRQVRRMSRMKRVFSWGVESWGVATELVPSEIDQALRSVSAPRAGRTKAQGFEAAQTALGHADLRITEIYAERHFELAARIMREIG